MLQLATNAVLNAIWDLWAKAEGKGIWRLVADLTLEFVRAIDFRYLSDVLTQKAGIFDVGILREDKRERIQLELQNKRVPSYNTSAGWLGYSADEVKTLNST